MVQENHIVKSLHKLYNQLYFKNITDFTIELQKHKFDPNGDTIVVATYIVVDHAKFWIESPDFNQEYYDFIFGTNEAEETLDEYVKYVISDRLVFNRVFYKHINTEVYEPVIDMIIEMGYKPELVFSERTENAVILLKGLNATIYKINEKVSEKYNVDDILFTNNI